MANKKKQIAIPDTIYYDGRKKEWKIDKDKIATPCEKVVDEWLEKWNNQPGYKEQESALEVLFQRLCPENKELDYILIKACTLNDFYSTNIYKVSDVAKIIKKMDIDRAFNSNSRYAELVDELNKKVKEETGRAIYSFASKYFSHHCPDIYPIYDSYVDKLLRFYRDKKQEEAASPFYFKDKDLTQYQTFCEVIDKFKESFNLQKYNAKQIDKFLWQAGKFYFPRYEDVEE